MFDSFLEVAFTFKNRQIARILELYNQNWSFWWVLTCLKIKKWSENVDSMLKMVFIFKIINRNQILGQSANSAPLTLAPLTLTSRLRCTVRLAASESLPYKETRWKKRMEAVEVVADCREIEMTNLASFYFQGLRKVCKFGGDKKKLGLRKGTSQLFCF